MVKGNPYPEKGFDLNLSEVTNGFVVEIGSLKGEKLVGENQLFFVDAAKYLEEKSANRTAMGQKVDALNQGFAAKANLTELHRHTLENENAWRKITHTCVDCQACNRVCPSCTCFLLIDQINKGTAKKIKVWDNCLHGAYTRVAGGANDRGRLFSRLQNRHHCKFDYMVERIGRYSCVGCGRCIDACCGKIDMRQTFKDLALAAVLSAKLE
jgi:formate hydrogenlyase subunit 6/NADH:ubiquinone oxidoreductase subunit I